MIPERLSRVMSIRRGEVSTFMLLLRWSRTRIIWGPTMIRVMVSAVLFDSSHLQENFSPLLYAMYRVMTHVCPTEPEDHDHKLPSLDEADLEGQFRLNQLDPLSKDGREIAGITNGARGTDDSTQWASRGRIDSPSSRDSESTFKAT